MLAAVVLATAAASFSPPARVILVGDSTMAPRTGYGDAFCRHFRAEVDCRNLARGGRSTSSFRAEGLWDRALGQMDRSTVVLVQFGHNDQPGKPGRSTDLATEFPANVARYVTEARERGATVVLVTPLSRRTFREGVLVNDLAPWADSVREVAAALRVPVIDLHAQSVALLSRGGPAQADALAMPPPDFDRTHLGSRGATTFAALVAAGLERALPEASRWSARPKLTDEQARAFSRREVLGDWDPFAEATLPGAPDFVVDASAPEDGRRAFRTVQAAVNAAVASGGEQRRTILVTPGTYRELVYVPESSMPVTLVGRDAASTRIVAGLHSGLEAAGLRASHAAAFARAPASVAAMFASVAARDPIGTSGSATTWIRNAGFHATGIEFANDHGGEIQAVALRVGADRTSFDGVRVTGLQDTLLLEARPGPSHTRMAFRHAYVEGDVDFIFGDATAYFVESEIRSLGRRAYSYALAPATHVDTRHGFVFERSRFTHDGSSSALAGRFHLGRQWFKGGDPKAVGKAILVDCTIGNHIDRARPWADWGEGTPRHRPVQFSAPADRDTLRASGPWLGEYRSHDE